ncbi:sugar-binding transcriptional regulator [Lactobacillus agilis]|uniref:Sugar-binding transcriptional regulator n=1 Tax=Ligilactobacillus agilis TaxID=1601 RepID=A0A848C373_9LACO|nr:sugar-binding transcriptional regulator [Ligilactobacillus agilis]NME42994.1 sugar-binding transcriptional regulator [Ligilactobacillus agilis]
MSKTDDKAKLKKALEVARLYYEAQLGQVEIAEKLGISRPTISRLLQFAQEEGIVQIKVVDPFFSISKLEQQLCKRYDLKQAKIVYADEKNLQEQLGKKAASYLEEIVTDDDIIGVSWGKTMNEVARSLKIQSATGVKVVELKGGITYTPTPIYIERVLKNFERAFNTTAYKMPLPVVFENKQTHDIVLQDRYIKQLIELGKQANIALFTVGTVRDDALLFQTGYFNKAEIRKIQANACGDICSRFYDEQGQIAVEEINNRTVGIKLEDLKNKDYSILIAGGKRKYQAIKGALIGGYTNCLITDVETAKTLLSE